MFTAHPTSAAIRRRLKPCFLNTSISIYTSFVITGASNTPIFSTRCINFQSLACINLYPLLTVYVNFAPAVSRDALKAMRQTIRGWHLQLMCDRELHDLAAMFNPTLRGWQQYYGRFHGSAMSAIWKHMNDYLIRWMMRKHKNLARHKTRAKHALGRLARQFPSAFVHWGMGCLPAVG